MKIKELLLIWMILLIILPLALGFDPGHDTLYIFKTGDNMTGALNVTSNVTSALFYTNSRFSGANLTITSDGNPPSVSNLIAGSSTDLAISSPILILNKANAAMVYVGQAATPASFNISGALYFGSTLPCLSNGTNCPTSLGGANITSNGAIAGYIPLFQSASTINNSIITQTGGANISIDSGTLFVDGTNNRVGIDTSNPSSALHVAGNTNMTTYNISTVNCILFDSGGKICSGT